MAAQIRRRLRRTFLPLLVAFASSGDMVADAALSIQDAPPQNSGVDYNQFHEDPDSRSIEAETQYRLSSKKQGTANSNIAGIVSVAGGAIFLVACALVFAWSKSDKRGKVHARSVMKEFKRAEAKRRSSGGSTQEVDPRQW